MNGKKRGGAHLDKNLSANNSTPAHPRSSSAPNKKQGTAPNGLDRRKKIVLIAAVALAGAILVGFLLKGVLDRLFPSSGLMGGLPTVPGYNDAVDPDSGDGPTRSEADSVRKEEFYTFLVVGRDTGGGGNTDTIMFCSYDIANQKVTAMSIPRDTLVDARHPDKNRKINGVWNLGLYYAKKGSTKQGIDYLKEAVADMTGIMPDFHIIVNWEAFGRLVDAIGGVDFEVPFDMKYSDPTQNLVINQPGGYRHLSGSDAMQVVRWRHNNSGSVQYADADLGRIRTQQALMKEIIKKCLKIENVTKINEFAQIFADEVETNLSVSNLLAFAERAIFGGLEIDNVRFITMPITATSNGYVQAVPNELLGVLNDSLNPYVKDLDMSELHVFQYSSSKGYYVYQGTGTGTVPVYSDIKPAQAVVRPEGTPGPETSAKPSDAPASEAPAPGGSPSAAPSGSPEPSASAAPSAAAQTTEQPGEENVPEPTKTPAEPAPAPVQDPTDMGIPLD